jgi:hypothetical protein
MNLYTFHTKGAFTCVYVFQSIIALILPRSAFIETGKVVLACHLIRAMTFIVNIPSTTFAYVHYNYALVVMCTGKITEVPYSIRP